MKRIITVISLVLFVFLFTSCTKSADVIGFADFGGSDTVIVYYNSDINTVYVILAPVYLGISSPATAQSFTGKVLDFYAHGDTEDFINLKIIISSILNKEEALGTEAFMTDFIDALVFRNAYFTNSEISRRVADCVHADISKLVSALGSDDINIEVINANDFISKVDYMYAYEYFRIWFSQII